MTEHISKLTRDLRKAAETMTADEARYLVDAYYIIQEDRKRSNNQVRAMNEEPHEVLRWFAENNETLEAQIQKALDAYSMAHPVGQWMRSVKGIGPVLAAGFLAHIDITKAPTVGHIWRFAGLDPTVRWEKGQKRPWNARLKVLCWKASTSFVRTNGEPGFYGKIYRERKEREVTNNEAGLYAVQAKQALERKRFGADTGARKAYEAGKLPAGHIDARARRYAVKLFLAHLHQVWYEHEFKAPPPLPYAIGIGGHAHMIPPPMADAA